MARIESMEATNSDDVASEEKDMLEANEKLERRQMIKLTNLLKPLSLKPLKTLNLQQNLK